MGRIPRGVSYCPSCGMIGSTAVPGGAGCVCPNKEENPIITNIVLEGGGIKSLGYVGALREMHSRGFLDNVKRVAGTSAGAITACLLALGYTASEVGNITLETDFSSFQDDSFGVIRDTYRLIKNYGWHKGDTFKEWLGGFIEKKLGRSDATFKDLQLLYPFSKELYVLITNLSKQRSEVCSYENTPYMPIVDAVRISMSIPGFFQCIKNEDGDILVDGGVANNYPIKIFDKCKYLDPTATKLLVGYDNKVIVNNETLGFRLDTKEEIDTGWKNVGVEIKSLKQYIGAVVTYLMEEANKKHLNQDDYKRTIFIDTGDVKATDFDLGQDEINMLIRNGKAAVRKYFAFTNK